MPENTTSQLLKRNREIAEVREQLIKAEKQLSSIQKRNKVLLEESSELDTEVTRQCARCGLSEEGIARLEDQAREREEEHAKQQAASESAIEVQMRALRNQEDVMRRNQSELDAKRAASSAADAELQGLQSELEVEETALEQIRIQRQAPPRPSMGNPAAQAQKAELQAIRARCDEQTAEAMSARQRVSTLEAQVAAESARRDELGTSYRQAMSEESKAAPRWEALESALAAHGGDTGAILGRVRRAAGKTVCDDTQDDVTAAAAQAAQLVASRVAELHSEQQEAEEELQTLQTTIVRARDQGEQEAMKLQTALDNARGQLQRNLKETAEKSAGEVSRLEAEVQQERQNADLEKSAEQRCAERIKQLRETRARAQSRRVSVMETMRAEAVAEAANRQRLTDDIQRAQSELKGVETRVMASSQRVGDLERQQQEVRAAGDRKAAKVRAMLEDVWRSVRMQATRMDMNEGLAKSTLQIPGVVSRSANSPLQGFTH